MALLSGTWYSRDGKSLDSGVVIKRKNIDTNDRIRIDATGIVYYDSNNDWSVDEKDTVIGALVNASALAKSTGIFTQDSNNPTLFLFGANTSDQSKGMLVIFNETYLKGLSLDPPPPVSPQTTQPTASALKTSLEGTLKNTTNIKDFIDNNLKTNSTVSSESSVNLNSELKDNVVLSGSSNVNATGNFLDNTLVGNTGNNVLDGGVGNDILIGGAGDDNYYVDSTYDTAIELAEDGIDTIFSTISLIIPKNIENLILTGSAVSGTGNELGNTIIGNEISNELYGLAGNDTLDGRGGNDNLFGGIGNDIYYIYSLADKAVEKPNEGEDTIKIFIPNTGIYLLPNNFEKIILDEVARVSTRGNKSSNDITGNSGDNIIYGDANEKEGGDDHILGLGGSDTLFGGIGNDYLDGGDGSDNLFGGLGNDIYIVDNAGDIVKESRAQGQDLVQSSIDYTLPENVEGLSLTGVNNLRGTGNALNNSIKGNASNNIMDGLGGVDILTGLGGADIFKFSTKPTFLAATADQITDFNPAEDWITISKEAFGLAINTEVSFKSVGNTNALGNALAGAEAFIYDSSSGNLYWNQNGIQNGAGRGGVFAILTNQAVLTAGNLNLF